MNNTQMHLHSENFDLCRICLLEPESNRHVKFIHIFTPSNGELNMNQQIMELLGVKVEKDDIKPKMVCENCHTLLLSFIEMKKKAAESQIVINYIATKKFGTSIPGTSNASYSSPNSRNKEQSSNASSSFTNSRSTTKQLNTNKYNVNGCSSSGSNSVNSNNKQGDFSCSSITNHSKSATVDSESDDDIISCVEVENQVETIDLLSSDNEETCKNECINEVEKLYYCSICQKKNILNHDCSQYNKSFFTCLVPNCNILSRSKKDFTPHYRRHIGLSSTAVMCRRCYQEIKTTDRDASGHFHISCRTVNLFKCYACNVVFNSMEEFAYHKLKSHNGRLMNSFGNYLCFYCEKSAPDLTQIIEHSKHCVQNQTQNVTEYGMKLKEPTENETDLIPVKKSPPKNVLERRRGYVKKIPRSSTHVLFTCLKPSCNLIFQNFNVFKFHHREHFELGNTLMCWQCCVPFPTLNSLRVHQVKGNCRIPGMFKCYQCSEQFDDLESLSIHKFTLHDGELIANKKNNKSIMCRYCNKGTLIHNFKSHLITCQYNNVDKRLKIKPKSKATYTKKYKSPYKCNVCNKVCLTAAALSSHLKTHNPSRPKIKLIKKLPSKTAATLSSHTKTHNPSGSKIKLIKELPRTTEEPISAMKEEYLMMANSGIKHEPGEEIIPSTSYDYGIIECMNNDMIDYPDDGNNEIDDETNTLSDNTRTDGTMESNNYESYLFRCKKCPRKFKSNSGLARHRQFCDKNTLKRVPENYYCTKCKKYFTRLSFFQHWRIYHGKRLPYHKYRRYTCKQCPFQFMYLVALTMHMEHVHGLQDNVTLPSNITPMNNEEMLPIISETTSLANNIAETTSAANERSKIIALANDISERMAMAYNIPETSWANNIPETSWANNIPQTSWANNIPQTSWANNIPETITENNKEHNVQIKQEANANTLSNQCGVSDNNIKENITEHNANERNNEISVVQNNEEQGISNSNDDGDNETDVYTAQSINQMMDQLNDDENIISLLDDDDDDDDTMAVNNEHSMDVSECVNIDKTNTKVDKNETSISSSVIEKQNRIGRELVALNDIEIVIVNGVNENKINNSVQALPSSDG
ncbi:zinc finger protein Xfin-like [Myzus persicae]|uniref:zinc finger protein Xfin-like n=1 Tax=Myzus persicae TaxID=13164 RepID=UPI000B93A068|nr:zinc finger protein Xfin-like [Myzus persicae]